MLAFRCLIIISIFTIQTVNGQITKSELPKEKQTTPLLYVSAKEAYEIWKTNPEKVKILDVRTPEEYIFLKD
jgi:hypothetical protein